MSNYDPNYLPEKSFALVGQKAIVLNSENKILVLQRSDKSPMGGKWSLPGGGLEDGEEPYESIKREINEETTLTISHIEPFYIKSYKENGDFVVIIGYICMASTENVKLNWEHDTYKWLTKEEALKLELTSDGRTFIELFSTSK